MERTGALLTRSTKVFFALTGSNTNDTLQKAQNELAPKLAAHGDAIFMDGKLFARVTAVYDQREKLNRAANGQLDLAPLAQWWTR